MKNKLILCALIFALPAFSISAAEFNVDVKTDLRVMTDSPESKPDYSIFFNRSDLVLKVKQESDNMKGYAEADLISWGKAGGGISQYGTVQPYELRLNEAYAGFYKVFFECLDLTIGKQVISWGSADKLNQVDQLTPYDFSDILDFNKRLGVNMFRADVNAGPVIVEGIYIPVFTPALLGESLDPAASAAKLAVGKLSLLHLTASDLTSVSITEDKPAMTLNNSMYAVRAGFKAAGADIHVNYFDGYLNIPVASKNVTSVIVNGVFMPASASLDSTLKYPKVKLVGADIASSLFSVGVWAEAGLYIPNELKEQTDTFFKLAGNGTVINKISSEETVLKDPYTKYTLGADYTFGDGTYANLQFMHGFFTEYGDNLSNLFFGRVEKSFFDDKLKLKVEGGVECDFNKSRNVTPGAMLLPGLTVYPFDSTEIEISGIKVFSNAKDDGRYHLTGTFEGLDQIAVKARYSF